MCHLQSLFECQTTYSHKIHISLTTQVGLGGIAVFSHGTIQEIIPSNAGNTAINCACATHRVPAVFYRFLVMASGQQLTEKCGTKSAVWKYSV